MHCSTHCSLPKRVRVQRCSGALGPSAAVLHSVYCECVGTGRPRSRTAWPSKRQSDAKAAVDLYAAAPSHTGRTFAYVSTGTHERARTQDVRASV
jgi:hypothetical protein